jgi:hypothetical protein
MERLGQALGFNPMSRQPSQEVFEEALKEVKKERDEQLLEQAKGLFKQAMALAEEFEKKRRAFQGEEQKFNKALGKLMGKIDSGLKGKKPPPEKEEKGEEDPPGTETVDLTMTGPEAIVVTEQPEGGRGPID